MIYFISDLHFYHANIIKSCNRPFVDTEEMNEKLIENFNESVQKTDEVYILGDLAYRYPSVKDVNNCLNRLNGNKKLIIGNHDMDLINDPEFDRSNFVWIKNYYELQLTQKKKIILFHYPILDWNGKFRGSWHIYGHIHNQKFDEMPKGSLNVSAENVNYKPISLDDAIEILSGRNLTAQ